MEHWTEYARFFTALLVILDPFMAVPILLALTHHYTPAERIRFLSPSCLSSIDGVMNPFINRAVMT